MSTVLVWFKNDLRLHDNEALHRAMATGMPVILFYCIDHELFSKEVLNFKKAGTIRKTFLLQSLQDLRNNFKKYGANILIKEGNPVDELVKIVKENGVTQVFCESEYAPEELQMQETARARVQQLDCQLQDYWGKTLYHIDDLPYTIPEIPQTSKAYRINTSKKAQVRPEFPVPEQFNSFQLDEYGFDLDSSIDSSDVNAGPYVVGGETAALDRLNYYTHESQLLTNYKWTRNRSLGMDYSSKLSPYMALGCISPRRVYFQVKDYESQIKRNISTWWLVFEVVWRDFFTFKSMKVGNAMFFTQGFTKKEREFTKQYSLFEAWCNGTTGIPFIDAHMRQLNQTGYMSNRGRVNCSSFLVFDLKIDWTWGAAYFESQLIDYDVTSNWMNWHNQAYQTWYTNPINQSLKYKAADYIKRWIPELDEIEDERIYIPWVLKRELMNYPAPVVMYDKWNRAINKILKAALE
ncbi:MAG: DASH family cryptochrome [Nonlabens sp.]